MLPEKSPGKGRCALIAIFHRQIHHGLLPRPQIHGRQAQPPGTDIFPQGYTGNIAEKALEAIQIHAGNFRRLLQIQFSAQVILHIPNRRIQRPNHIHSLHLRGQYSKIPEYTPDFFRAKNAHKKEGQPCLAAPPDDKFLTHKLKRNDFR